MNELNKIDVLLVEDNPNDAELALRSLKKHNLANHVHWVKDGAEALEYVFGNSPDTALHMNGGLKLILLDLKLPKVSGREVLEKIKGDPKVSSIPVVVMTSSDDDRDVQECYQMGANSYITKPVEFEKFVKVVADLGLYWLILNEPPPDIETDEDASNYLSVSEQSISCPRPTRRESSASRQSSASARFPHPTRTDTASS